MQATAISLLLLASLAANAAEPPLAWNLPQYATLGGDVLIVDVPPEAARQGCRAYAEIDLSAYDGVPFEAEIVAHGERIGRARDSWNGLKFQFEYDDPDSGERFYPNTEIRTGDFSRETLRCRDSLCTPKRNARIVLGLQDTSGKVVFDLSTLRIRAGSPYWPVTNQTHRCVYSEIFNAETQRNAERNLAQSPRSPQSGNPESDAAENTSRTLRTSREENPSASDSLREEPVFRGVMSSARDMTEDDFATLREWGATLLCYQMIRQWHDKNANRDLDEFDRWLAGRLDHFESFVLPMCRKCGIKVVLDLHVPPGGRRDGGEMNMFFEREYAEHFIEVWRRIAERFKGNADVIYGHDLINEPVQSHEALPECDWWSLQRRAAEAIREIDPDTPIIVESNNWDVPSTYANFSPLALDNVIYEVHVYNPIEYTHQAVGHRSPDRVAYPNPERGWDKGKLRGVLSPVRAFAGRHGARIYVGEFSAAAWAPGAENYLRDCIELFEEYGWDWTYHAFRESRVWDVEMEGPHWHGMVPADDSPRKRALLDGLRR